MQENILLEKEIDGISRRLVSRRWIRLKFKDGTKLNVGPSEIIKAEKAKKISDYNVRLISIICEPCPVRF